MKQHAKTAIINSFKDLLNKQPMDKLTVKEICKQCDVDRHTFYYYFRDIMDIFKYIVSEELTIEIAQNRTFETWEGGFLATMKYLKKNARMVFHTYHSSYWPEANDYFTNFSNKLLYDVIEEYIHKMGVKLRDKDYSFIVNFYRRAFNGLMIDWVDEGMEEEPQIILKKLLIMLTGSIPRSVTAFVEDKTKE